MTRDVGASGKACHPDVTTPRLADLNGATQTSLGQNGPFWFMLVLRMVNSSLEEGHFDQDSRFGPFWTILDHFGPAHLPTVPRPLLNLDGKHLRIKLRKRPINKHKVDFPLWKAPLSRCREGCASLSKKERGSAVIAVRSFFSAKLLVGRNAKADCAKYWPLSQRIDCCEDRAHKTPYPENYLS